MRPLNPSKHPKTRTRNALVLITVLWVVALLIVIVTMTAKATRLDVRVGVATSEQILGRWACRAGLEKALAILKEDLIASDCLTDTWSDNPEELDDISLGRMSCAVNIVDEAAKLNVNTATKQQLMELPNMTDEIAAAIIDWRDGNDDAGPGGAEIEYYINLPLGYRPRNSAFCTIREMLLVKDVTAQLLYGEDRDLNGQLDSNEDDGDATTPADNADGVLDEGWIKYLTCYSYDRNTDAEGTTRVNINEADERKLQESLGLNAENAKWIVENRNNNYTSIAALLPNNSSGQQNQGRNGRPLDVNTFKNIADKITISSDAKIVGRVNVNTAPRTVLVALLQGREQIADDIIAHRESLSAGMVSIAELLDIRSVTNRVFEDLAEKVTTRSSVFTVKSKVTSIRTAGQFHSEAVIDRNAEPSRILYLYQGVNR